MTDVDSADHRTDDPAAGRTLPTPNDTEIASMDAWWRANNYLTIGQIYLKDNPLLSEPLTARRTSSRDCSVTGAPAPACPSSTPT